MSEILPYLIGQSVGGSGAVSSVFGRTGAVSAQSGDFSTTLVSNVSSVAGATVTAALDKLAGDLTAVGAGISDWKQSVKTRTDTPPGSPVNGDRYLAGANPTGAWAGHANAIVDRTAGTWVFTAPTAGDAVNTEDTGHAWVYSGTTTSWNDMGATTVAPVLSVFGRTGAVTAQSGDFTATQITLTPTGDVAATTVQAGIAELAAEKAVAARLVTAGPGLTGGGDLSADRTLTVGAGSGITVNADDVAVTWGGTGAATTVSRSDHNHDATYAARTTQVATQYSLYGGGDLSATRTLSLVNDSATPGATKYYGTDASGTKGFFPVGSSGSGVTGVVENGALTYTNATTTPTAIKAGGFQIDSAAWPQVGSQVTLEIVGVFSSGATTARTIKADVTIGGQSAGTITSGQSGTNSSKPYKLTIVMRRTATGFAGSTTLDTNSLPTGLTNFTTTQSVTGTITVAVNGYLGMTAGTGYQMTATAYSIDKTMAVSGIGSAQRTVATMTALRAIDPAGANPPANGELCYLQGFVTAGDGGEGYFAWSALSSAAENYGTIIVPDTAPAQGRWVRQTNGQSLRFEWFGARGDGVTDDTVAMERTLAVAGVQKGTVYVTDGKTFLYADTYTLPDDVSIVSNGHGTISMPNAGTWFVPGLRNLVRGVRFIAPGRVNGQFFYRAYTSVTQTAIDLTIDACEFWNVQLSALNLEYCSRVNFINNRYIGDPAVAMGWSYNGLVAKSAEEWLISGNFMRNAGHVIHILGGRRCRVANNHVEDGVVCVWFASQGGAGISVADHVAQGMNADNVIVGNEVRGWREEGISFDTIMDTVANSGQNKTICSDLVYSVTDPDSTANNRIQINLTAINAGATTGWANGYYVGFLNGRLEGFCAPVIASGKDGSNRPYVQIAKVGGGITDDAGSYIANTDRVFIFVGNIRNSITGNVITGNNKGTSVSYGQTGISLWGCCWLNNAVGNVIVTRDVGVMDDGYFGLGDNTAAVGPNAGNNLSNNSITRLWDTSAATLDDGGVIQGFLTGNDHYVIRLGNAGDSNLSTWNSGSHVWPRVLKSTVVNNVINHTGSGAICDQWGRGTLIDGNRLIGDPKDAIYLAHSMQAIVGRNYGANNNLVMGDDIKTLYTVTLPSWNWAYQIEQPAFGIDLDRDFQMIEDFAGKFDTASSTAPNGWVIGASSGSITSEDCWWDDGSIGVITLRTGASATGSAYFVWHKQHLRLDRNRSTTLFDAIVYLQQASSSAQRFTTWTGLVNAGANSTPTIGCWFDYSDNVNGGKWRAVCGDGSQTAVDTGITPAVSAFPAIWTRLTITQSGSAVKFYINGSLVATITTNVPLANYSQALAPYMRIAKSVGTTECTIFIDAMRWGQTFGNGRYGNTAGRPRRIEQYWG